MSQIPTNCSGCSSSCQSGDGCSCQSGSGFEMTITFDDGQEHSCKLLAQFEINDQDYVVLEHPVTKNQLMYRYTEIDKNVTLDVIEGEEFDLVAKIYQALHS